MKIHLHNLNIVAFSLVCGLFITGTPAHADDRIRQGPQPLKPGAVGVGRMVPDLEFVDLSGTPHRLSDFANQKAVIIALTNR